MTPAIRLVGIQWDVRAEADRLVVTVGGEQCPTGPFKIRLAYEKTKDVWQPMDADLSLGVPNKGGSSEAFFAAFYRPTQHFSGIVIPQSHGACSVSLERIVGSSILPLAMSGEFANGELVGPLNKGFGSVSAKSRMPGIIEPAPKK
jgi:hypothetical protein